MGSFKNFLNKFALIDNQFDDNFLNNLTISDLVEIITFIDMLDYCQRHINGFVIKEKNIIIINRIIHHVFYNYIFHEKILRMMSSTINKQIVHICRAGDKRLTDKILISIAKYFPDLEILNISWNNNITDAGIINFTNLKSLNAGICKNITDFGLKYMEQLETLHLQSNNNITGVYFPKMKLLKELDISCCNKINSTYLHNRKFNKLSVCFNCSIDNDGIEKLKHVEYLDISGNEKITDDIFFKLKTFNTVNASYNNKIKKRNNIVKIEN